MGYHPKGINMEVRSHLMNTHLTHIRRLRIKQTFHKSETHVMHIVLLSIAVGSNIASMMRT